ncbi:hypothetical protein [Blastopirellula marina]|uniref:Uncharacterized protein n=1 Tax=Blastopirellula marina TaxID=124 RepID=A0A2S8GRP2_9BACT|nr:hypothetical protein [Blastopirellula marina]PQO47099.1 hypothetical protein C5Y93_06290 [Blastopirellula marina]
MDTAEQLVQHASELLEILERGEPFALEDLTDLVRHVEQFCDHFPEDEEVPRKVSRLLTELVPALDSASQKYGPRDANRIQEAAASLFVVMLEKL